MSQPSTPPTRAPVRPALSPEDGLVAPLSVHQIAAWVEHDWTAEPLRRINEAADSAWALHESLKDSASQEILSRLLSLLDYLDECYMVVALPEELGQ